MANRTIGIVVSDEDYEFIANWAETNWSFVSTIARGLLAQKISELRAAQAQEETEHDSEAAQVQP